MVSTFTMWHFLFKTQFKLFVKDKFTRGCGFDHRAMLFYKNEISKHHLCIYKTTLCVNSKQFLIKVSFRAGSVVVYPTTL